MTPVTAERARELLTYDPLTGEFTWRVYRSRGAKAGWKAGFIIASGGPRLGIKIDGRIYQAGRLAWLMMHGKHPEHEVDHIDGDPLNNRIANLRDVPHRVNQQNIHGPNSRNGLGWLGVKRLKGRFYAVIGVDRVYRSLGGFATPEEAHAAYLAAKRELHEGCTI